MKKYLLVVFVVILSACSPATVSNPVQEITTEEASQAQAPVSTSAPAQEVATEEIAPTQTPVSTALKYYPLDTQTGNADIDVVLSAVASGEPQDVISLFGYTTTACKTVNALGGPPPCRTGETEGTMVEVFPFLGPEGSYLRKDEVGNFPGLNVIGLYAIYQVSENAYAEENFPKGDHAIVLAALENRPFVVLQIKNGMIIRIDYVFDPASLDVILKRDASDFVVEPVK